MLTNEEEFEYREELLKQLDLEISDYQESDATNTINCFSLQHSPTSFSFQSECLMDAFKPVVAEE